MSYVEVHAVSKRFGQLEVLNKVSFTLERGQVLAVIGPSGSGKTTILRCLNGLEQIDSGTIHLLDGEFQITAHAKVNGQLRSRVGMVFQGFNLWPHRTVLENLIEAPMCVLKMSQSEATGRARELLAKVKLSEKESSYPATLSGGEAQRVAIARAMAMQPQILLLDEITSALDPELVWEVLEAIRGVVATGTTVVMVTHQMGFAKEIADQVIFLDHGRIVESGTAKAILQDPQHPRTREFLRRLLAGNINT